MAENSPLWLKHSIIYQVFLRNHSKEGSFNALSKDLNRIRNLGIDIIWIMGIHPIGIEGRKGILGSPFAIKDYNSISNEYGSEIDFINLINEIHFLGMKVLIDIVYNHTSLDSVLINKHPEWFLKDKHGEFTRKWQDWDDIYDLDFSQKSLYDYLINSMEKWVDKGVDGFRCDVASLIPLEFWIKAREKLNNKKQVIFLAESVDMHFIRILRNRNFTGLCDPELHTAFDLTYDYDGYTYLWDYFINNNTLSLHDYFNHLFVQETLYPAHAVKMRFLENHDRPRIAHFIKNENKLKNWTAFCFLLPGAGFVYAGQELGIDHLPDLFEKDVVDWSISNDEFYEFFRNILKVSKNIKKNCHICSINEIDRGAVCILWENDHEVYSTVLSLHGDILENDSEGELILENDNIRIYKKKR